jgi:hypothetical protein
MTDKIANPAIGAPGTLDACSTELKNISTNKPIATKKQVTGKGPYQVAPCRLFKGGAHR